MKKKPTKKPTLRLNPPPHSDDQAWLLTEQEDWSFVLERQKEPNFAPPGIWLTKLFDYDHKIVGQPKDLPSMKKRAIRMAIKDIKFSISRKQKMIKSLEGLIQKEMANGNKPKKPAKAKKAATASVSR